MARSFKLPYYTDHSTCKFGKRIANRRVRKRPHIANGGHYKKVYEQWDIRDYKFYCPDDPKAYRK